MQVTRENYGVCGVQHALAVLALGQSHYPENLRRCFVLSAPSFFSVGWAVVSPVLSETTVAKIEILGDDGGHELEARTVHAVFRRALACGLVLHHKEANVWGCAHVENGVGSALCAEYSWVSLEHARRVLEGGDQGA